MADAAPMRRVLVSGISGAGKSTLARELARLLDLPYTELDALHHGPGWVRRPEFEADAGRLAASEAWITEDQYNSFLGTLLWDRADTIVWLDLPRPTVMRRVIGRTTRRLLLRERVFNDNRERWRDVLFSSGHPVRWSWTQHAARRQRIGELVAQYPQLHVVHLRTAGEADAWMSQMAIGNQDAADPQYGR